MTLDERIVAERQALLAEKLEAVERLAGHLKFSLGGNPYPLGSLSVLDPVLLESVSALVERFGKLQDLLSGVFRVCNFGDSAILGTVTQLPTPAPSRRISKPSRSPTERHSQATPRVLVAEGSCHRPSWGDPGH